MTARGANARHDIELRINATRRRLRRLVDDVEQLELPLNGDSRVYRDLLARAAPVGEPYEVRVQLYWLLGRDVAELEDLLGYRRSSEERGEA